MSMSGEDIQFEQDLLTGSADGSEPGLLDDRVTLRMGTYDPASDEYQRPFKNVLARNVPANIDAEGVRNAQRNQWAQSIGIGLDLYAQIEMRFRTDLRIGARIHKEPASLLIYLDDQTAGRTLTVQVGDYPTTPLPLPVTAAVLQAALQALVGVGPDKMFVSGPTGGPYFVSVDRSLGSPYIKVSGTSNPRIRYQSPVYQIKQLRTDETRPVLLALDTQLVTNNAAD